jgi:membrane-associated phospholipid phosphatase
MIVPLLILCTAMLQETASKDSAFFQKDDGKLVAGAVAGTSVMLIFDERIARWARQPTVQGDSSRHDLVDALTVVNEVPLTLGALATYGIGRLTGSTVVTDVGAHLSESLIATVAIDETLRITVGRVRPRSSPDNAFVVHPGSGLTHFDHRSFPSLHSAVAFATAAALCEEMRVHDSAARVYLEPALYVAATIPGFTRIYLDQHWSSDIVAGSFLGAYLGARIVRYAHARRTKLDQVLLGMYALPRSDGVTIGWSLAR